MDGCQLVPDGCSTMCVRNCFPNLLASPLGTYYKAFPHLLAELHSAHLATLQGCYNLAHIACTTHLHCYLPHTYMSHPRPRPCHTHTYVSTCTHTHMHTHMHAHTHTHTHTHRLSLYHCSIGFLYTSVCTHTHTHTYTHTHTEAWLVPLAVFLFLTLFLQSVYVHKCMYTPVCTHTHAHTHTHTHTHTHAHTHTHTHTFAYCA